MTLKVVVTVAKTTEEVTVPFELKGLPLNPVPANPSPEKHKKTNFSRPVTPATGFNT